MEQDANIHRLHVSTLIDDCRQFIEIRDIQISILIKIAHLQRLQGRHYTHKPYWHVERARIGGLSNAWSVTISGHTLYVANGNDGVAAFDITRPTVPVRLGAVATSGPARSRHIARIAPEER